MNIPPTDDDLARAHEVFRRHHEAGRQRLLEAMSGDDSTIAPYRSLGSQSRMFGKMVLAATLLVALTLGFYSWHGEQRAYAMEDLPKRLLEIQSIYMTGWSVEPDGKKYSTTLFAARPNCYWYTRYTTARPDATHEHSRILSSYIACAGRDELCVCLDDKKAWVDNLPPIASELKTERVFQHQILPSLLDGSRGDFVKTGSEVVNNTPCDVYEGRWVFHTRVWLDPKSGLPVKIAYFNVDKTGQEQMRWIVDHIEVNVPASDKGLSFAPPEGYQITRNEDANPLNLCTSSVSGFGKLTDDYFINIDDKAVLVCWACDTRSGDAIGHGEVTFVLGENRQCDNIKVVVVDIDGRQWNWSLVFPKTKGERIGSDGLKVFPPWSKSHTGGAQFAPVRFPEERLRSVIQEIQQATKTIPAGAKPFTLDMLRKRLDGD